jgi:transposase-like protein
MYSKAKLQEFAALYTSGMSYYQIARTMRMHRRTLQRWARELGFAPRRRGPKPHGSSRKER